MKLKLCYMFLVVSVLLIALVSFYSVQKNIELKQLNEKYRKLEMENEENKFIKDKYYKELEKIKKECETQKNAVGVN